jgi:NitT/TauT family transport system substrate-binding protein
MPIKIAVPDLISNSYFPVLAASELGKFRAEGLEAELVLMSPADMAYQALRNGEVDFVAAEAHAALAVFPRWSGVKLICAQAQGMYWFLVMRADLGIARGDLHALKGLRIGAAPWVEMGLRRLLAAAGLDPKHGQIEIGPVPGATGSDVNFGLTAAEALAAGKIDGFWANGMATELAITTGVGAIVLDVRRGDGPPGCFDYTMPVLATTDGLIARSPETAAAAVRALVAAQNALKHDVSRATDVGHRRFPPREAELIAGIVRRDLPFYDASIAAASITAVNCFAREMGVLADDIPYDQVVATQFRNFW